MYKLYSLLTICLLMNPAVLFSAEKTLSAEYTYELGENDSRNDARQYAFLKAKKKLITESEQYIHENADAKKKKITVLDTNNFLPILLKIDSEKEEWIVSDTKLKLSVMVRTRIDTDYIFKRITEIKKSKKLKEKIKKNRKKIVDIQKEYEALNSRMKEEGSNDPVEMRKQRQVIAEKLERLEKIIYFITSKTRLAQEKISAGMTIDEVIDVAGQPRATMTCDRPDFLNYGRVWVMLRNGVVIDLVPIEDWRGPCLEYGRQGNKKQSASPETPETDEIQKYEIIMENGKVITTSNYYEIEGIVYYKRYGGIVGIEKAKIIEIKDIE